MWTIFFYMQRNFDLAYDRKKWNLHSKMTMLLVVGQHFFRLLNSVFTAPHVWHFNDHKFLEMQFYSSLITYSIIFNHWNYTIRKKPSIQKLWLFEKPAIISQFKYGSSLNLVYFCIYTEIHLEDWLLQPIFWNVPQPRK